MKPQASPELRAMLSFRSSRARCSIWIAISPARALKKYNERRWPAALSSSEVVVTRYSLGVELMLRHPG
jgi:hypothetical protein